MRRRCGITRYAEKYREALAGQVELCCADIRAFRTRKEAFYTQMNRCDCVHIQYEPVFFLARKRDFFPRIMRKINRPVVLTLHEVYRAFPWEYPRDAIDGPWPLRAVKKILFDLRHPYSAAYRRHCRRRFFGSTLLVHHRYHREILAARGVDPQAVHHHPMPVTPAPKAVSRAWSSEERCVLGTTGFFSRAYDIPFLFRVLERLTIPWRFVWIGSARTAEHRAVERSFRAAVEQRGWEDRVRITGWVDESHLTQEVASLHVVCSFFVYRSSSMSVAEAVGVNRPVVGTPCTALEETQDEFGTVVIKPRDATVMAHSIETLFTDPKARQTLVDACERYQQSFSWECQANRLVALYESITGERR